jgi:hypothetical protein
MSKEVKPTEPVARFKDERIYRQPPDPNDAPTWTRIGPCFDPRDLGPLFASNSHLLGDDKTAYDELLSKATAALVPRDFIEAIWVKEFVDRICDAQFYRRMRIAFLTEAQKDAVQRLLQLDGSVIARWATGDKAASAAVEKALKTQGLDWDTVRGRALSNKLDKLEQLDDMIGGADARRDKALHSLERRRESGVRPHPRVIEGGQADHPKAL